MIIRSPPLRAGKIVFGDAKRLLQHYLPTNDIQVERRNSILISSQPD
jgi:hypothetical protein